jgi:hypothetical protein
MRLRQLLGLSNDPKAEPAATYVCGEYATVAGYIASIICACVRVAEASLCTSGGPVDSP